MLKRITQKLERMVRMMAMLWAQEIMSAETMEDAKALYERCPRLLKEKVKAILVKSGFEEITQQGAEDKANTEKITEQGSVKADT